MSYRNLYLQCEYYLVRTKLKSGVRLRIVYHPVVTVQVISETIFQASLLTGANAKHPATSTNHLADSNTKLNITITKNNTKKPKEPDKRTTNTDIMYRLQHMKLKRGLWFRKWIRSILQLRHTGRQPNENKQHSISQHYTQENTRLLGQPRCNMHNWWWL